MTTKSTGQENLDKESRLLGTQERAIVSQIAATDPPYSQRAQALLALDEGLTQAEAGRQAGLTSGQVRYWLRKFRTEGTAIFPQDLLSQTELDETGEAETQQEMLDTAGKTGPIAETAVQSASVPEAKKKPKKKSKKKSKKRSKKSGKSKKRKKTKKDKKKKKKREKTSKKKRKK